MAEVRFDGRPDCGLCEQVVRLDQLPAFTPDLDASFHAMCVAVFQAGVVRRGLELVGFDARAK